MPGEPITKRGRASRERIVERAAELFAERGIAATSVDEVLAAAGFDAWEQLLAGALERMCQFWRLISCPPDPPRPNEEIR